MSFLPETPRQRKLLVLMICILSFVALDIYFGTQYAAERETNFRAFRWDSQTFWALRASYNGTAWGKSIHTNSSGFRGGEEYPVKSDHAGRIITFGDSRTYGFGAKDDETYSYVLQETLRKKGIDAEVINAGVHGFSAVQCRNRLLQLLRYKPDAAVFAPGYNDRRYLVIRPVDADASIPWITRIRRVVDFFQTSNTFFAFMYEVGKRKLTAIRENPPGLDTVEVRVPEETFREELQTIISICRENSIQPVFLRIYQNPAAFSLAEKADCFYREGDYQEAVETIEEAFDTIPDWSYSLSRWVLGSAYRKLGEEEKAKKAFSDHQPLGSVFGESVVRSEASYFSIYQEIAAKENIPMVDARDVMAGDAAGPREAEDAFPGYFIDECHYSTDGHRKMGEALAELLAGTF